MPTAHRQARVSMMEGTRVRIQVILDQIDLGAMALPEFQRGYVWNREQVRGLMDSMYRKHPVGSLLVWVTRTENAKARGDGALTPGSVKLLLDGQQRITSLYGIIRGGPPLFFDGNVQTFTGLYFHLEDEVFEFYAPLKMKGNPLWISVTELMHPGGLGAYMGKLLTTPELNQNLDRYLARLNAVNAIRDIDLHIEEVTGEDKTVDVVVDIFNRVNSGGTKLSKGDLALAKICAAWPDARDQMKLRLEKWRKAGFHFRLDWLLRNINTIVTGEAVFAAFRDVDTPAFQGGLQQAEKMIDTLLNVISGRLGLDDSWVLGGPAAFPLMTAYLVQRGGQFVDYRERDKLLYWYVHTFLWGRYAGSTETVLNQDLALIENKDGALDRLINQLRQNRGDLRLQPNDFLGWSRSARFYPLLYMLTRACHTKDLASGVELSNFLLGHLNHLEVHHIFPKALLYKHGYSRPEVNAIANFTFLTQGTNLMISDRNPVEYLAEYAATNPGAVESHWIPADPRLWRLENYPDFLAARRELLAAAANRFLDSLMAGSEPELEVTMSVLDREVVALHDGDGEDHELRTLNAWVVEQGLPSGEYHYELADPVTGGVSEVLDLAWPRGLQEGLSTPVALLLDAGQELNSLVNHAGYRYFTDPDAFRAYVRHDILTSADAPSQMESGRSPEAVSGETRCG